MTFIQKGNIEKHKPVLGDYLLVQNFCYNISVHTSVIAHSFRNTFSNTI